MTRMADQPTVEVEVQVAAPASVVWELVTDPALPARFSAEFQEGSWDPEAPGPALGARILGHNRHPAIGEWRTTSVVVVCEPGRRFSWAVGDAENPAATWSFEIDPVGGSTDSVVVRQRAVMGPGPSGLTAAIDGRPELEERIVASRLAEHERNMRATLEGIKALAEAGAP